MEIMFQNFSEIFDLCSYVKYFKIKLYDHKYDKYLYYYILYKS